MAGFLSGTTGYVKVGVITYRFGKWKITIKAGTPKVTNFAGSGYQQIVPGVVMATITLSGAYDSGNMPLAANSVYAFHLGMDTGVELAIPAQVSGIEADNDVEGTPTVSVTAESTGVFTAAIT
jgi:hypothetical protein